MLKGRREGIEGVGRLRLRVGKAFELQGDGRVLKVACGGKTRADGRKDKVSEITKVDVFRAE